MLQKDVYPESARAVLGQRRALQIIPALYGLSGSDNFGRIFRIHDKDELRMNSCLSDIACIYNHFHDPLSLLWAI